MVRVPRQISTFVNRLDMTLWGWLGLHCPADPTWDVPWPPALPADMALAVLSFLGPPQIGWAVSVFFLDT